MRRTVLALVLVPGFTLALLAAGCGRTVAVEETNVTSDRNTSYCEECNVVARTDLHRAHHDRQKTVWCETCGAEVQAEGHVHGLDTVCPTCHAVVLMDPDGDQSDNLVDSSHSHARGEPLSELCSVCLVEREAVRPDRLPSHDHFRTMWCEDCQTEVKAEFRPTGESLRDGQARPTPWAQARLSPDHVPDDTIYCGICDAEVAQEGHVHGETAFCREQCNGAVDRIAYRGSVGVDPDDPHGVHRGCLASDQELSQETRDAVGQLLAAADAPEHDHNDHYCVVCGVEVGRQLGEPIRIEGVSNPVPVTHDVNPENQHPAAHPAMRDRLDETASFLEQVSRNARTELQRLVAEGDRLDDVEAEE